MRGKLDFLFCISHLTRFARRQAVIIHKQTLYTCTFGKSTAILKWVCHCSEGDNDSRSQSKWVLMKNDKSSLPGLMAT